jgi:tRNA(Glu) U13 pseudouridine synthase TruD
MGDDLMADYPLETIGIYELFEHQFSGFRPAGWIKQFQEDFQVREVRGDEILEARTENRIEGPEGSGEFIRFTVSKLGVPSPAAEAMICQAVGAKRSELGVSGRKDAQALTSGRMSLPAGYEDELVDLDLSEEGIWIQDLAFNDEPIHNGSHSGNNFRIVIRPNDIGFDERDLEDIEANFEALNKNGFVNFWGDQRFGTRRISQIIGARMIAGDWLGAAKLLLYESPKYEQSEFRQARLAARKTPGWPSKREILSHAYFGQELAFVDLLEKTDSLQQALMGEGEINFLLSAWGSWMWNQAISVYLLRGWGLPRTFPSFRGIPSEDEWNEAGEEYSRVGINLPPYPRHLRQEKAHVIDRPTKAKIKHGQLETLDEAEVVVSFTLPGSVYATMALENVIEVREYDVERR